MQFNSSTLILFTWKPFTLAISCLCVCGVYGVWYAFMFTTNKIQFRKFNLREIFTYGYSNSLPTLDITLWKIEYVTIAVNLRLFFPFFYLLVWDQSWKKNDNTQLTLENKEKNELMGRKHDWGSTLCIRARIDRIHLIILRIIKIGDNKRLRSSQEVWKLTIF